MPLTDNQLIILLIIYSSLSLSPSPSLSLSLPLAVSLKQSPGTVNGLAGSHRRGEQS